MTDPEVAPSGDEAATRGDLTWGGWSYAGGNGMRVGLQAYGGSGVTTGSASWSMLWDVYTGNQYNYNDSQTLSWSSCAGGSLNYTNGQATGSSTMRKTVGCSYNYTTWGSSPGRLTLNASVSGTYNGSAPSHSSYVDIPARPYAAPNVPTSVASTRNSDSKTTITWNSPATAQKPVTNYTLQVMTYTGSAWSGWVTNYTGTSRSVAVTTSVNHSYKYQVRANNSVGSSGWVAAPQTYTTPSAPTSVAANASGTSVVVTWASAAFVSSSVTHKVERSVDGGGTWASMKTGIAQATKTWTDTAPGSSNLYRVATVTSAHGGLSSSWVQANEVVLNDCWVWDGAVEIPAVLTLWNGTAEVPLSIDSQVFAG